MHRSYEHSFPNLDSKINNPMSSITSNDKVNFVAYQKAKVSAKREGSTSLGRSLNSKSKTSSCRKLRNHNPKIYLKSKYIYEKEIPSMSISTNSNEISSFIGHYQEIKVTKELNQSSDDIKKFKPHIKQKQKARDRSRNNKTRNNIIKISTSEFAKLRIITSYTPDFKSRKYSNQTKQQIESSLSSHKGFLHKMKQSAIKETFKQRYNLRKNSILNTMSKEKLKEISRELKKISKLLK